MARKDKYAAAIYIDRETLEELEKMKDFYRQMEEDLNRDPENCSWRVDGNQKFDRNELIKKALKDFNK